MTDEILELMEKRQLAKHQPSEYKRINEEIQRQCRMVKKKRWIVKYEEIEKLQ